MLLTSCYQYRIKDGSESGISNTQGGYNINSSSDKFPVINVFLDYLCEYCSLIYPKVLDAAGVLEGTITIKLRHFPNYTIHKNSIYSARAIQAAGYQDKYIEMAQRISEIAKYLNNSELTADDMKIYIYSLSDTLRLNKDKFVQDYESDETFKAIKNDYILGKKMGVYVTPSFYTDMGKVHSVDSQSSAEEIVYHIKKSLGFN